LRRSGNRLSQLPGIGSLNKALPCSLARFSSLKWARHD
jgi:hypothetical protein